MKISSYKDSSLFQVKPDVNRVSGAIIPINLSELKKQPHGIVILGLADDQGVKNVGGRPGASKGPEAFRQKFYRLTIESLPYPLYDLGDLNPEANIEATHAAAQSLIKQIHEAGHVPFIIGGGHDLAYPEAAALLEHHNDQAVTFINLDAHLDLRHTHNGITSGSPWYLLAESTRFIKSKSKLIEIGVQKQCNSSELVDYAKKHKITVHWLHDLRKKKVNLEKLLTSLLKSRISLVSLDIDGVRWSDAPGCSAPQNTGFTAEEAIQLCYLAGTSKTVKSFGIYELSPPLDRDNQTAALVARCAHSFLEGYTTRFKVSQSRLQLEDHGGKEKKARRRK